MTFVPTSNDLSVVKSVYLNLSDGNTTPWVDTLIFAPFPAPRCDVWSFTAQIWNHFYIVAGLHAAFLPVCVVRNDEREKEAQ